MADVASGVAEGVRVSIRSMVVGAAGSLLLAVASLAPGLAPPAAAAGDPYETTTTYTVDPDTHEVAVVIDLVPAAARLALDGPGADHLFHVPAEQVQAWVADSAVSAKATLGGASLAWTVTASSVPDPAGYHQITINVPAYQARAIRHVQVAFAIPSADVRSSDTTRVLADYVHLCVHGNGPLDGRVVIDAPTGFGLDPFNGPSPFDESTASGSYQLDSGALGTPETWSTCLDIIDPAHDHVATVITGGGSVTLRSWPGDTAWQTRVTASIENAVPALVALVGRPIPKISGLVVREAVVAAGYEGQYGSDENTIVLSEAITDDSVTGGSITVAHELAHAWFNRQSEGATWLSEGTAEWAAESVVSGSKRCTAPPNAGTKTLATWTYLSADPSQVELQAVWDEYDTACAVVTQVAAAAGKTGTRIAINALMDKRDPYGSTTPVNRTAVTWRDWLDAMDELGVYPNGGSDTLAGSLLLKYGVANETDGLKDRQAARDAYHALIRHAAPWNVPNAIRAAMTAWKFQAAETAIQTAQAAYDAVVQADVLVPGSNASAGPIRIQWESAQTQDDLDGVLALAKAQRDAAKDVADAMAPLQSPLGFVPWVGSLGSRSTTLADAKAAVGADNPASAEAAAIALRAEMLHYESVGQKRLAIGGIIAFNALVLIGLVIASVTSRRRTRRRLSLAPGPADGPPTAPMGVFEVAPTSGGADRDPRLPPAPPAWFGATPSSTAGPPPTPHLHGARPLLPPMTSPPPSLPPLGRGGATALTERSEGAAQAAADPSTPPPPPRAG